MGLTKTIISDSIYTINTSLWKGHIEMCTNWNRECKRTTESLGLKHIRIEQNKPGKHDVLSPPYLMVPWLFCRWYGARMEAATFTTAGTSPSSDASIGAVFPAS
jgi:hypothetical protein